jgi:hypothetical protein
MKLQFLRPALGVTGGLTFVGVPVQTAIPSRMSTYTGKEVTWDQALNSKFDAVPKT